jgi:hypothetical protein
MRDLPRVVRRVEPACGKVALEEGGHWAPVHGRASTRELRRMIAKTIVAGLVATTLSAVHAFAVVSVTNRDDKDHKLTIVEGETRTDHVLKPTQVLEGICDKGCVIRLNDSENDEYELEGTEVVSIEEGYLYYDGPEENGNPGAGDAGKAGKQ